MLTYDIYSEAFDIADAAARSDIECWCAREAHDGAHWYNLITPNAPAEDVQALNRNARYLRERRKINFHPKRPTLVNFDGIDP